MAGIFTEETMNNLAGPQLLEPLSFLRPRGKKLPEKIFRPDTNPQRHPQHSSARRVDSMRFTNISGATLLL